MVGGLVGGIAAADLQLPARRQLETQLPETGEGGHRIGTLQQVFRGETRARIVAYDELIGWRERGFVAVRVGTGDPGQKALVGRDDVEFLGPEGLIDRVREPGGTDGRAIQVRLVRGVALLIARYRPQRDAVRQHIVDSQHGAAESIQRQLRSVGAEVEQVVGRVIGIGRIGAHVQVVEVGLPQDRQGIVRLPQEPQPGAIGPQIARVARVGAAIRSGDVVEAVAPLRVEREACGERVTDGQIHRALEREVRVVSDLALHVAGVASVDDGIIRGDEHGTAGRVLASERALWTAQNLEIRHVVVRLFLEISRESREAVAIGHDAHGGLGVVLTLADAADVEIDALPEVVDRRAGRGELQGIHGDDTHVTDVISAEDSGRDRRALRIRMTPLRRDDDLLQGHPGRHISGIRLLRARADRLRGGRAIPTQRQE